VPWLIVAGLASLSLLWPLSALTGVGSGVPRALVIIGVTALVWIGVVGLGRVPRPVLTLTLTGVGYGAIGIIVAAFLGGTGAPLWTAIPALALDALWGCLAGLLALGVQLLRDATRRTAR
jgi:hypothetical protein